jgi:hypothetical protein
MTLTPEQLAEAKAELSKTHALVSIEDFNKLSADVALLRKREEDLAHLQKDKVELERQLSESSKKPNKNEKDIDAVLAEKEKEIRTQLQAQMDSIANKNKELASKVAQKEVVGSFKSEDFTAEGWNWVKKAIGDETFLDDNGQVLFKGENGQPAWSRTRTNEKMGVDEYKGLLLERFKDFVPSSTRSGDGDPKPSGNSSAGNSSSSNTLTWAAFEKMSPAEQDKVPVTDLKRMAS